MGFFNGGESDSEEITPRHFIPEITCTQVIKALYRIKMQRKVQAIIFNAFQHPNGTTVFLPTKSPDQNDSSSNAIVYSLQLPENCDVSKPVTILLESNRVSCAICEILTSSPQSFDLLEFSATSTQLRQDSNKDLNLVELRNSNISSTCKLERKDDNTSTCILNSPVSLSKPYNSSSSSHIPSTPFKISSPTEGFNRSHAARNISREYHEFEKEEQSTNSPEERTQTSQISQEFITSNTATNTPTKNVEFPNEVINLKTTPTKLKPGRPLGSYSNIKDIVQTSIGFKCTLCSYVTQSRPQALKHRSKKHAQQK